MSLLRVQGEEKVEKKTKNDEGGRGGWGKKI